MEKFYMTDKSTLELLPEKGVACFLPATSELRRGDVLASLPKQGASGDLRLFRHLLLLLGWNEDAWRKEYTGVLLTVRGLGESRDQVLGWFLFVQAPDHVVKKEKEPQRGAGGGDGDSEPMDDAEAVTEYVALRDQIAVNARDFYDLARFAPSASERFLKPNSKRARGQPGARPMVEFTGILPSEYGNGYQIESEIGSTVAFHETALHVLPWIADFVSEFSAYDMVKFYSVSAAAQRMDNFLEKRGMNDHPVCAFVEDLVQGSHKNLNVPFEHEDESFYVYSCKHYVSGLPSSLTMRLPLDYGLPAEPLHMIRYCNGMADTSGLDRWRLDNTLNASQVEYACYGELYHPKPAEGITDELENHPRLARKPMTVRDFNTYSGEDQSGFLKNLKGPGLIEQSPLPLAEIQQSIEKNLNEIIGKPRTPAGVSTTWSMLINNANHMIENPLNLSNMQGNIFEIINVSHSNVSLASNR